MLSAIGSSTPTSSPADAGTLSAGLEARLARYQKELADCVNCDSANTREGRETIQVLSNKVSEIKARIEEVTATNSSTHPAAPNARTSAGVGVNRVALASGAQDKIAVATVSASGSAAATVGSRLDVFA